MRLVVFLSFLLSTAFFYCTICFNPTKLPNRFSSAHAATPSCRDLACGLSFLCCGSKSSKLAFAYSLFAGSTPSTNGRGGRGNRSTGVKDGIAASGRGVGSGAVGGVNVGRRTGGVALGAGGRGLDDDDEGELSRDAIAAFVSGLLTVLCSCVGQMLELTNRQVFSSLVSFVFVAFHARS